MRTWALTHLSLAHLQITNCAEWKFLQIHYRVTWQTAGILSWTLCFTRLSNFHTILRYLHKQQQISPSRSLLLLSTLPPREVKQHTLGYRLVQFSFTWFSGNIWQISRQLIRYTQICKIYYHLIHQWQVFLNGGDLMETIKTKFWLNFCEKFRWDLLWFD